MTDKTDALVALADRIEALAFKMPAPNEWTPQFVSLAVNARHQALAAQPVCTCPSGDGSLRWPCPSHPPAQPAEGATDAMVKRAEDYFYDNSPFSGPDELREGLRGCLTAALSDFAGRAKDLPGMWEESDLIGGETDSREAGSAYANATPQPAEGDGAVAWHIQHEDGLVSLRKPESVDSDMREQAAADGVLIRPLIFGDTRPSAAAAVDDAMVDRAIRAFENEPASHTDDDWDRRCMRAALTAALAQQEPRHD